MQPLDYARIVLYLFASWNSAAPSYEYVDHGNRPSAVLIIHGYRGALMGIASHALTLRASRKTASIRTYYPIGTIKCDGVAIYRSQVSRDAACIFDFDPAIVSWKCLPFSLPYGDEVHVPDFEILDTDGCLELVDGPDRDVDVGLLEASARRMGMSYRRLRRDEIYGGPRLRNTKDLLRYANYEVSLGDRLRLLSGLEENGTLTVAESLTAFSETKPVAGLAVMILNGFIEVDLDSSLIGPETLVRRIRA